MVRPTNIDAKKLEGSWARRALFVLAWFNVALGLVGVVVPGMPTTVFLIAALWAFSKSSERFHHWLWNHPRFGEALQNWHMHQVIPIKAKVLAVLMMSASYLYLCLYVASDWVLPVIMASIMLPAALYVVSRASSVLPPSVEQVSENN